MIYETQFSNKRDENVRIFENGKVMLILAPGDIRHVESTDPMTHYSRWKKITFTGEDRIHFDENKSWEWPFGPEKLMLTALNSGGADVERMNFGGIWVDLYKGIPTVVPISYDDTNWYWVESVEKRLFHERVRSGEYIISIPVLRLLKIPRSKKEIKAIEARLVAESQERAKRETERTFPRLENEGAGE